MNEHENSQSQKTSHENNELSKQLEECRMQVHEWKDRALRTAADYENYKKRAEKERTMWITGAQSSILLDLISIVDDFDRAFLSLRLSDSASVGAQVSSSNENSAAGFELIYKSLQKILEKYGVHEIKEVDHFDPLKHEAIMHVESPDHKTGDIVQVLQKGYMFKGEVLRPAKVSVAK